MLDVVTTSSPSESKHLPKNYSAKNLKSNFRNMLRSPAKLDAVTTSSAVEAKHLLKDYSNKNKKPSKSDTRCRISVRNKQMIIRGK